MSIQQDTMISTEQGHRPFAFNPEAATFNTVAQPFPRLSPLALPFIPTLAASAPTSDSTTTSSPSTRCPSSMLNPIAPPFTPAPPPDSDATESMTETTEQAWSASSVPAPINEFTVDACTREELDFPDNQMSVNVPGLVTTDDTFDTSSCSIASTADDIEYKNQEALIYQDPDIHHINWMGTAIMTKTSTPAAVSLTVALTPAKSQFVDQENLRDHTILREAMLTVDPIVFYGDLNQVKDLKGEALRDAAIGAAAVCYTPFGQWKNESFDEDDERPLTDELDLTRYTEGTTIVNGWLENGAPTRQDFWRDAEESYYGHLAVRRKVKKERKLFGLGYTPLRSLLNIDGLEYTKAAKQRPSTDASGLIPPTAFRSKDTAGPLIVHSDAPADSLLKNANWADDLNDDSEDEDDHVAVSKAAPVVEEDGLFKNHDWADDLDEEEDFVAVGVAPSPVTLPNPTKSIESPTPFMNTLPIRTKPDVPWAKEPPVIPTFQEQITEPARDKTTAEYVEGSKALMARVLENLKPKVEKHLETISAFKSGEDFESREDSEGQSVACPVLCPGHLPAAVDILNKSYEEPQNRLDSGAEVLPGVNLRFIFSPIAANDVLPAPESTQGQAELETEKSQEIEEIEAIEETVADEQLENVEEQSVASSSSTSPAHLPSLQPMPDSLSMSLSNSCDTHSPVVSPLGGRKDRGLSQVQSVASDHTKAMPKFSLVSASMEAMLVNDALRSTKLEEIAEEDEELAETDRLSDTNDCLAATTEEEEVVSKVDLAVSKGHVSLKRSSFCGHLPALLPASAEDGSNEEPTTREQSPCPSPYTRPSSNTPNTMLGKKVKFATPEPSDSGSCTTGAGAVFDDNEEEEVDASSILSGAVIYDRGAIYLQRALASKSFSVLPAADSTSGSGSMSDDIFTRPSAGTTAPSTVGSSREGSPSPSVIPQPAQRPLLVAEPSADRDVLAEPVSARSAIQERSTSVQRRSPPWTKAENKLRKPRPIAACQGEKKKGGLRGAWKKVKNAFVKGVKALA